MKKKYLFLTTLSVLFLAVTGCTKVADTAVVTDTSDSTAVIETEVAVEETENVKNTFTDSLGREIEIEKPQKVVTLLGSFTDIWLLSGGDVVAATKDSWTNFDLQLDENVVNLGNHQELDLEQLLATKPDLVIASANLDAHLALEDTLQKAGIAVAYFDVSNVDDYLYMLDICTQITDRPDLYEKYGIDVANQIKEEKKRVDDSHPRILFLRASASGGVKVKKTKDSVGGEMLVDLGCINIADSDESLLEDLSMEAIIAADPDYIFVTTQGSDNEATLQVIKDTLEDNPAWGSLSAVKNGNYHLLDKTLFNAKPNARWGEAYKILADILYE